MDEQLQTKSAAVSGISAELCTKTSSFKGRIREINIQPLDTGFVVRVGCQSLAITNKKQLLEELTKYFDNPRETEKRYYEGAFGEKNEQ